MKERMEASKNNKDSHAIAMNSKDDSLSAKYAYCNTI